MLAVQDGSAKIQTLPARYSFVQLKEWQAMLDPLFSDGLLTMSDADERKNAVTLGVAIAEDIDTVLEHGIRAGVPRDALNVVEANFSTKLLDDDRPLAGGQQIQYAIPIIGDIGTIFYTGSCSLGIPAM